ncbi:MAG: hypothetical protein KAS72_07230 [Phycisphaerales bacterium]|nr:hypothetical protein [Phycisphaerales bacterium]
MRKLLVNALQLTGLVSLAATVISAVVAWDLFRTSQWEPHGTTMVLTAVVAGAIGLGLWTTAQSMYRPAKAGK